jgi:hypothetical protein
MIYFFNVGHTTHCLISLIKVPDMRTYENEHNNALALTLFITSNLEQHNLIR